MDTGRARRQGVQGRRHLGRRIVGPQVDNRAPVCLDEVGREPAGHRELVDGHRGPRHGLVGEDPGQSLENRRRRRAALRSGKDAGAIERHIREIDGRSQPKHEGRPLTGRLALAVETPALLDDGRLGVHGSGPGERPAVEAGRQLRARLEAQRGGEGEDEAVVLAMKLHRQGLAPRGHEPRVAGPDEDHPPASQAIAERALEATASDVRLAGPPVPMRFNVDDAPIVGVGAFTRHLDHDARRPALLRLFPELLDGSESPALGVGPEDPANRDGRGDHHGLAVELLGRPNDGEVRFGGQLPRARRIVEHGLPGKPVDLRARAPNDETAGLERDRSGTARAGGSAVSGSGEAALRRSRPHPAPSADRLARPSRRSSLPPACRWHVAIPRHPAGSGRLPPPPRVRRE